MLSISGMVIFLMLLAAHISAMLLFSALKSVDISAAMSMVTHEEIDS